MSVRGWEWFYFCREGFSNFLRKNCSNLHIVFGILSLQKAFLSLQKACGTGGSVFRFCRNPECFPVVVRFYPFKSGISFTILCELLM